MKVRRKYREAHTHAVMWAFVAILGIFALFGWAAWSSAERLIDEWSQDLPSIDSAESFNSSAESYMYADDGTTLLAAFQIDKRDPVTQDQISPYVLQGTVAVEDVRFYQHNGIDPIGIARAIVNDLAGKGLEGASTITQQLVRNTVLSEEMSDITLERKVREAELAVQMEQRYSKDEILVMYLNTINYGDGCYGIEAAAQNYFQTSASDLTLAQAATLIGIPQSPIRYNPKENPDACLNRRNTVLDSMLANGVITQGEHDEAASEPLGLNPAPDAPSQGIYRYPYFTSYVRDQLLQADNPYGCSYADLFEGGLTIYTTLDPELQDDAESACENQYARMSSDLDAALVAMDPTTGYVRALVGGKDFSTDQWNIAVQGGRPAGSTFKAFTLAAAIEKGISPDTSIDCSNPVTLSTGQTINNFDNIDYGTRSIRSALAVSSNTGFYRLAEEVSASSIIDVAHRAGIDSSLPNYPIITLGTENVTPLEMAEAYSTFADQGVHHDPVVVTKIVDGKGNVLYQANPTGDQVFSEDVANTVTDTMRAVFEESDGTAYGKGPSNGQPVAGKTGTGMEFRDHWMVGYSPTLTCAAWIGNRDYSSTSSTITAVDLWQDFMSQALANAPITDFPSVSTSAQGSASETGSSSSSSNTSSSSSASSSSAQSSSGSVPSVIGKSEEDARSALSNYEVKVEYAYTSTGTPGSVISQKADGDAVTIIVARSVSDRSASESSASSTD